MSSKKKKSLNVHQTVAMFDEMLNYIKVMELIHVMHT